MKIHEISKCLQVFWCLALARVQFCSLNSENLDSSLAEKCDPCVQHNLGPGFLGRWSTLLHHGGDFQRSRDRFGTPTLCTQTPNSPLIPCCSLWDRIGRGTISLQQFCSSSCYVQLPVCLWSPVTLVDPRKLRVSAWIKNALRLWKLSKSISVPRTKCISWNIIIITLHYQCLLASSPPSHFLCMILAEWHLL